MYNSSISVDKDGYIVASTDYDGLVAFYLKHNNVFIEKKLYEIKKEHVFDKKVRSGTISVLFFFKDRFNSIDKYETNLYRYNESDNLLESIHVEILAECENYRLTHYNQDSDITFVTFNGTKTTKRTMPFGMNFIIKNGWNLISVAQDNDTQYQDLSLEVFYNAINPAIFQKTVYAYGVSLGGYCALYYGGSINATIIAASPKNSAHPSINLARFKNLNFNHKSFSEVPTTEKEVYITYDPLISADMNFISDIVSLAYQAPNYLPVENGTHMILQSFLKADVLKIYIYSIVYSKYNSNISEYIIAKHKYSRMEYDEAFVTLDKIAKNIIFHNDY